MVDLGSYTSRVGYAGEDMPKADFPSCIGIIEEYTDRTESMDTGTSTADSIRQKTVKYLPDVMSIKAPKSDMNVQSYLKDGLIDDWDLFEKVVDFMFDKHLRCDPSKHPILFTEPVVTHFMFLISRESHRLIFG